MWQWYAGRQGRHPRLRAGGSDGSCGNHVVLSPLGAVIIGRFRKKKQERCLLDMYVPRIPYTQVPARRGVLIGPMLWHAMLTT